MRKMRALWMRLIHAARNGREFDNELESHLAMHTEEAVRTGLSAEEARRQAMIRLGGAEQARQAYRERAGLPFVETVFQDLRYALRGLRRNPVFAVTAILTLALGIGATTAVFSVVDRILFRPLPYAHPDQLVSVGLTAPIVPQEFMLGGSYFAWRDNQTPFSAFTSETGVNACDLTENNPAHLSCAGVEANFLPTLGVSPILGRNLPDGRWYTVTGVAENVKNSGLAAEEEPECYQLRRDNTEDWQQAPSAALVVRTSLPPQALAQWIRAQIGGIDATVPVDVETLDERVSRLADQPRFETALLGFFAFTGLVMAVIGLYGVMAYMAMQRTQEIGVRMALGAGRRDILRLILSEGMRLVALGSLVGLAAALAVSRVLKSLLFHIGPHDPLSYAAVMLLLGGVALAAALLPARAAMKTDPMAALRVD